MHTWQLQQAKAKFSELIDDAEKKGPQMITRRGVETAVVIPVSEWRRLQKPPQRSMLELLQSGQRLDIPLAPRGRWKLRKPASF